MKTRYSTARGGRWYRWACSVFLVLSSIPLVAESGPAKLHDECVPATTRFESVQIAVEALSKCYLQESIRDDREVMAGLISDGETVRAEVSRGSRGRDRIRMRISVDKGHRLVAIWHTHGAHGLDREKFSPTDVDMVRQLGRPLYLTDPNGFIRRLDPDDTKRVRATRSRRSALKQATGGAEGILVGRMSRTQVPG